VATFPRVGMVRVGGIAVGEGPPIPVVTAVTRGRCGKLAHPSESAALAALITVREHRIRSGDPVPEQRVYQCERCNAWHLTRAEARLISLGATRDRRDDESWEQYARRLERRIAAQRAELMSLHALGHGLASRDARRRVASLVISLGRMTERWEAERRNREALVAALERERARTSLFARLRSRFRALGPEAVSSTEGMES